MARNDTVAETEITMGGEGSALSARLEGHPVADLRQRFRRNIHKATRKAKKEMVRMVKRRHRKGEPGTGYDGEYAERKSKMTGRGYSAGQQYDYEWSGQLHSAMEGRGRAQPSKDRFNIWIGFRRQQRRPIRRSPNANSNSVRTLTNQQLAEVLNQQKLGDDPAIGLHSDEHPFLINKIARMLAKDAA